MRKAAPVVVLLCGAVACGDVVPRVGRDGGADGDGGVDADPTPGEVAVTLSDLFGQTGGPSVDTPAVFVQPDGAAIEAATDEHGRVAAEVAPGTAVFLFPTASPGARGAPAISVGLAILGLEPGDDIVIGNDEARGANLGVMTFQVGPGLLAPQMIVSNGCGTSLSFNGTASLSFDEMCVDEDDEFAYVLRVADEFGNTLGYRTGVEVFVKDGVVVLDGAAEQADAVAVDLGELPGLVGQVNGRLTPFAGPLRYGDVAVGPVGPEPTPVQLRLPAPRGFGDGRIVEVQFQPSQGALGGQIHTHRLGTSDAQLTIDAGADLLPWLGQAFYSIADREVVVARTAGAAFDVQVATLNWAESAGGNGIFLVMTPPELERLRIPALPDAYAGKLPVDPMPNSLRVTVLGIEASALDGYRAARQRGFEAVFDDAVLRLGDEGSVRRTISREAP